MKCIKLHALFLLTFPATNGLTAVEKEESEQACHTLITMGVILAFWFVVVIILTLLQSCLWSTLVGEIKSLGFCTAMKRQWNRASANAVVYSINTNGNESVRILNVNEFMTNYS
ncbi:hypothetical protein L5515_017662 [Caenorhabditis briggsae]|uniref:Uncharacterized protein n=1 Tax=Caenorhabditis briggsae TaxID=6238 RepID=A0AAE9JSZ1_CAEBR|nr:hypothetical protein L5515_017662 [Caenorhabditis briggsae]